MLLVRQLVFFLISLYYCFCQDHVHNYPPVFSCQETFPISEYAKIGVILVLSA